MELKKDREGVLEILSNCADKDKELMILPEDLGNIPDNFHLYVAVDNGVNVGCVSFIMCEDGSVQAGIYIIPRYRGFRGIYLMMACDEEAIRLGANCIYSPVREDNKNMLYLCDKHDLLSKPSDIAGIVLRGKVL